MLHCLLHAVALVFREPGGGFGGEVRKNFFEKIGYHKKND